MPSSGVQTCGSEEHTSELQSHDNLVCRLLLEKKKQRMVRRPHNTSLVRRLTTRRDALHAPGLDRSLSNSAAAWWRSQPPRPRRSFFLMMGGPPSDNDVPRLFWRK